MTQIPATCLPKLARSSGDLMGTLLGLAGGGVSTADLAWATHLSPATVDALLADAARLTAGVSA